MLWKGARASCPQQAPAGRRGVPRLPLWQGRAGPGGGCSHLPPIMPLLGLPQGPGGQVGGWPTAVSLSSFLSRILVATHGFSWLLGGSWGGYPGGEAGISLAHGHLCPGSFKLDHLPTSPPPPWVNFGLSAWSFRGLGSRGLSVPLFPLVADCRVSQKSPARLAVENLWSSLCMRGVEEGPHQGCLPLPYSFSCSSIPPFSP